ncbi:hypothetical protein [Aquirhabdus sp.]|uniref:hypothetical protein n=1 Tax=Aquirhabdus sp. TaxID=2824160 RepID=UPI00396C41EE
MQINATIQPSKMQRGVTIVAFLAVALLGLLSALPLLAKVVLLLGLAGYAFYTYHVDNHQPRIVQLIHMDRHVWRWVTVLSKAPLAEDKEEGDLHSLHRVGWVMLLGFRMQTSSKRQIRYWVIWRDQVCADDWRRLMVLARFWMPLEMDQPKH